MLALLAKRIFWGLYAIPAMSMAASAQISDASFNGLSIDGTASRTGGNLELVARIENIGRDPQCLGSAVAFPSNGIDVFGSFAFAPVREQSSVTLSPNQVLFLPYEGAFEVQHTYAIKLVSEVEDIGMAGGSEGDERLFLRDLKQSMRVGEYVFKVQYIVFDCPSLSRRTIRDISGPLVLEVPKRIFRSRREFEVDLGGFSVFHEE